jgi:hypothetical protein
MRFNCEFNGRADAIAPRLTDLAVDLVSYQRRFVNAVDRCFCVGACCSGGIMHEPKKYREIASDLERKIKAGELLPGARLPSDAELGEIYTASRNTVREAVRLLVSRGLAEKRSGRGRPCC